MEVFEFGLYFLIHLQIEGYYIGTFGQNTKWNLSKESRLVHNLIPTEIEITDSEKTIVLKKNGHKLQIIAKKVTSQLKSKHTLIPPIEKNNEERISWYATTQYAHNLILQTPRKVIPKIDNTESIYRCLHSHDLESDTLPDFLLKLNQYFEQKE